MDNIKITEQESLYDDLEKMTTRQLIDSINEEDRKVAEAVGKCKDTIATVVDEVASRLRVGGRLFYIGAGTSGRLGVLDASEIPPTFGVDASRIIGVIAGGDAALRRAVEQAEDSTTQGWTDLMQYSPSISDYVIGIAASGSTPYVVEAIREATSRGIGTACICSVKNSPLSLATPHAIEVIVGPEFLTGSSRMKSGTAQKMILNMISTSVMIKLGRVKGNLMIGMQITNRKLWQRGIKIVASSLGIGASQAEELLNKYSSVEEVLKHGHI